VTLRASEYGPAKSTRLIGKHNRGEVFKWFRCRGKHVKKIHNEPKKQTHYDMINTGQIKLCDTVRTAPGKMYGFQNKSTN